jgi:hypothetical protein
LRLDEEQLGPKENPGPANEEKPEDNIDVAFVHIPTSGEIDASARGGFREDYNVFLVKLSYRFAL